MKELNKKSREQRKSWNGKPYRSLDYMLRERFGEKVYKVTLNGGMSCPNRDGTLGTRAVFSAAREEAEILRQTYLCLSQSRLKARSRFFPPSGLFRNILRIFRRIPTPMRRWNISGRFLRRQCLIQGS